MSGFQAAFLASGSKGNAAVIFNRGQYFLVDMGLSCRELVHRLRQVQIGPEQLSAVFITHEHIDHVKGLATFTKQYSVPVYSSERTWRSILSRDTAIRRSSCHIIATKVMYNDVAISSFGVPHDAADPHGYVFENTLHAEKCAYLTDTGFVTDEVRQAVEGSELLILEANHDVELLKNGSYPHRLKQRILSTRGHLSNDSAGHLLAEMTKLPENIFLAHLSEENNNPQLALQTIRQALLKKGNKKDINIHIASQNEVVSNFLPDQQDMFIQACKE